jgi:hypothetical protein
MSLMQKFFKPASKYSQNGRPAVVNVLYASFLTATQSAVYSLYMLVRLVKRAAGLSLPSVQALILTLLHIMDRLSQPPNFVSCMGLPWVQLLTQRRLPWMEDSPALLSHQKPLTYSITA